MQMNACTYMTTLFACVWGLGVSLGGWVSAWVGGWVGGWAGALC